MHLSRRLVGILLLSSFLIWRFFFDYRSVSLLTERDDLFETLSSLPQESASLVYPRIVRLVGWHHDIGRARGKKPKNTTKHEMEMRNPLPVTYDRSYFEPLAIDQRMCKRDVLWQVHPSCNNIHEISVHDLKYLGSGGWRLAFSHRSEATIVLKMLRMDQLFEALTYRRHETDAIISDQMTSNQRVISANGFCGQTILTQKAKLSLSAKIRSMKKTNKRATTHSTTSANKSWDDQLVQRVLYARDAAAALASVHQLHGKHQIARVAHHDVKPDNFMILSDDQLVLNDFNDAELLLVNTTDQQECRFRRPRWSIYYKSPEDIFERPLTHKIDVYSLGGVLYFLLTGKQPYHEWNKTVAAVEIMRGHLPTLPQHVLATAAGNENDGSLIMAVVSQMSRCLAYDPNQRPSAHQVAEELSNVLAAVGVS